jgi:hypothetical protein
MKAVIKFKNEQGYADMDDFCPDPDPSLNLPGSGPKLPDPSAFNKVWIRNTAANIHTKQ